MSIESAYEYHWRKKAMIAEIRKAITTLILQWPTQTDSDLCFCYEEVEKDLLRKLKVLEDKNEL